MENYKKMYEKAFAKAKDLHDNHALGMPFIYETCEKIFPELKESEDERIRREIIKHFEDRKRRFIEMEEYMKPSDFPSDELQLCQNALTWLEMQGEQRPVRSENTDAFIDKAIEWIRIHWREYVWTTDNGIPHFGRWEKDFEKAMKGH